MPDNIKPHDVAWTPDQVSRFWDYYSTNTANEDAYFARQVGHSLIRLVHKHITIGDAVDIGCGPGDLLSELVTVARSAVGADGSPASVDKVKRRFDGTPGFKGAALMVDGQIDLPSESVDTAFMLEVVEHMDDVALNASLAEARRVLRPGGHLVLTTPNEEDIDASKIMCPECAGIFHPVQHVRSWSAASLTAQVRKSGFECVHAEATLLSHRGTKAKITTMLRKMLRPRRPNLVLICCKSTDA